MSLYPRTAMTTQQDKGLFCLFFPPPALKDASEKLKHLQMENSSLPPHHPNIDVNINNQVFRFLLCVPVTHLQSYQKSFLSKANTFSFLLLGNLYVLNS